MSARPSRGDLIAAALGEDVVHQMMDDLVGGLLGMLGVKETAPARPVRLGGLRVIGVREARAESDGPQEGEAT